MQNYLAYNNCLFFIYFQGLKMHRLNFVKLVQADKDSLFGKFSSSVTHEGRQRTWANIRDAAVNAGAADLAKKNPDQIRSVWTDMKRRTLEKMTKRKSTGTGRVVLTEVFLILA